MNLNVERIKSRATQKKPSVRINPETFEPEIIPDRFYNDFDLELFVQLLVDESAELVADHYCERTQECAGVKLRDHWGIEEKLADFKTALASAFEPLPNEESLIDKNRIHELAKLSGYVPLEGFNFANSLEEALQYRFAWLIIEECCDLIADLDPTDKCCLSTEYRELINQIRDHFDERTSPF